VKLPGPTRPACGEQKFREAPDASGQRDDQVRRPDLIHHAGLAQLIAYLPDNSREGPGHGD
jgi:hypothetical protein